MVLMQHVHQQTLNRVIRSFVASGGGGQAHVNATLIFAKSIEPTAVTFDFIANVATDDESHRRLSLLVKKFSLHTLSVSL